MRKAGSPVAVSVALNGEPFAKALYFEPGGHTLAKPVPRYLLNGPAVKVHISVNPFVPPNEDDKRALGAVVPGLGFVVGK